MPYPNIDPVIFRIGPLAFRWYGMMYALSFISAIFIIRYIALKKKLQITHEQISDLMLYGALGVILGGRLGYVLFYNPGYYVSNPSKIIAVWEGGMSFHGGLIGAILGGLYFCRRFKFPVYSVADVAIVSAPIGLALGRIGNFMNGELFGRETDVPWCMIFPAGGDVCRHPSQLYEAALEGGALFIILWVLSKRDLAPGVVFWTMILGYGVFRFLVEFAREPDAHLGFLLGAFSMGQILSAPMILLGVFMIWRCRRVAEAV
ncbi:MAG: prolipoprotein diacylglyceryl transferase [Nitrospiria bacterium]